MKVTFHLLVVMLAGWLNSEQRGYLRTATREFMVHYRRERNHQGLCGRLIEFPGNEMRSGPIACRERLGGLLRYYYREAA